MTSGTFESHTTSLTKQAIDDFGHCVYMLLC